MARITGNVSKLLFFRTPVDSEVLGMDGKQVWYGSPDGLGSVTADDVTDYFEPVVSFTTSEAAEDE